MSLLSEPAQHLQAYSLDWDKQYLEDEARLRACGGYGPTDTMLMPPLAPGAQLWVDLPAEAAPAGTAEAAPEAAAATADTPAAGAELNSSVVSDQLASQTSMFPSFADKLAPEVAVEVPGGFNVLVVGPHRVGKSTQAAMLAARYGVPIESVDGLVMVGASIALSCSFEAHLCRQSPTAAALHDQGHWADAWVPDGLLTHGMLTLRGFPAVHAGGGYFGPCRGRGRCPERRAV